VPEERRSLTKITGLVRNDKRARLRMAARCIKERDRQIPTHRLRAAPEFSYMASGARSTTILWMALCI
jgi:hypothetical protein